MNMANAVPPVLCQRTSRKPKLQITQGLLEKVLNKDLFPTEWVVCDATFGNSPVFGAAVAAKGMYVAGPG